jgi:hypothetical protein
MSYAIFMISRITHVRKMATGFPFPIISIEFDGSFCLVIT